MTPNPKITAALDALAPGGWSLTVLGFAAKTMKIKNPDFRQRIELRDMMNATGLPLRRVMVGGEMVDVWDVQK